jgi:membrane protein
MQFIRNPQLWLSLGKEIWERNRGHKLKQIAASLAFTTTLALIPMLTVASMLISHLPSVIRMRHAMHTWLLDTYMPGGMNQQLFRYLEQFSLKAKGLTLVGSVGLFITTILTVAVIESALNQIFRVTEKRPLLNKIGIYAMATLVAPLFLGVGVYLSGLLLSAAGGWSQTLSFGLGLIATLVPILLTSLVFMVIYKILPYANVLWSDAFTGAFFATIAFELMKFGFGLFLTNDAFYKTVYGAFAILPLLLIWIYLTWWITLAGAVLVANLPSIRSGVIRVIRY